MFISSFENTTYKVYVTISWHSLMLAGSLPNLLTGHFKKKCLTGMCQLYI